VRRAVGRTTVRAAKPDFIAVLHANAATIVVGINLLQNRSNLFRNLSRNLLGNLPRNPPKTN
jgi:hypothetical protein